MKKIILLMMLSSVSLFAQSQNPPAPNQRSIEGPVAPGEPASIENFCLLIILFTMISGLVFMYLKSKNQFVK